jgi:hypothetical protein
MIDKVDDTLGGGGPDIAKAASSGTEIIDAALLSAELQHAQLIC